MHGSGTAVHCLKRGGFFPAMQFSRAFHQRSNATPIKAAAPRGARLTADPRAGMPDEH
jgi:hypothetical protein